MRRYGMTLAAVGVLVLLMLLLYALRSALFPFALGLVLAYLMLPFISWSESHLPAKGKGAAGKRVLVVAGIFALGIGGFTAGSFYIGTAIFRALNGLVARAPEFTAQALAASLAEPLRSTVSPQFRPAVDAVLNNLSNAMGSAVQDVFAKGGSHLQSTLGFMLSFFSMPIFVFYLLKDWGKLSSTFDGALPPQVAAHSRRILGIIANVMGRWLRAQLILGLVVGTLVYIGLLIVQVVTGTAVPFAIVLALMAGATEMIPFIGPWIGGITGVIVTLAFAPQLALPVAIVYLSVQLLENVFLVPRIQGGQLNIHPAVAMLLLVVGTYVAGFWGLLLMVPLAATVQQVYHYMSTGGKEAPSVWSRLQVALSGQPKKY